MDRASPFCLLSLAKSGARNVVENVNFVAAEIDLLDREWKILAVGRGLFVGNSCNFERRVENPAAFRTKEKRNRSILKLSFVRNIVRHGRKETIQ